MTFRQTVGGSAPARYPTEAVLTAVRLLAEAADADRSPMGAELRATIAQVDPNLPIEIVYPGAEFPLPSPRNRIDQIPG